MFLPYVVRKSSIVLLSVRSISNILSVIFIEHTFIIYMHKRRIVYTTQSVNPNIYVVEKSIVRKCINITHVAESSRMSRYEVKYYNTCHAKLREYVVYTVTL